MDSSTKYLELWEISQVFCIVIHRHNDEGKTAVRWQKLHKSGTMDSLRKGVPAMAIKYTEEQLDSVDKSYTANMLAAYYSKGADSRQMFFGTGNQ